MIEQIPLGLLDPSENNARKTYTLIEALAATILECGLLQNLVVRREGER